MDGSEPRPGVRVTRVAARSRWALRPASLVGWTAALLSPGLILGPGQDAAVYVLAGLRIRQGYMPYRDLFDNKPPGVYVLNAVGQFALPWVDPWLVAWLLSLLLAAGSVLVIDALLRRSIGPISAWVWSVICCAGIAGYLTALGGGLTETYALLPLVLALWIVVARPRHLRTAAAVGALLAAACLVSLECAPAALAIACACVYEGRSRLVNGRRAAVLAIAAAIPVAAVLAWLGLGGAVASAFDQIVPYNEAYRLSGDGPLAGLPVTLLFLGGLAIPMLVAVIRMSRDPSASDTVGWVSLAWLVGWAIYLAYQNRVFPHYLIMAVPPLILLSARGTEPLWSVVRSGRASLRQLELAVLAGAVFMLSVASSAALGQIAATDTAQAKVSSDPAAAWIRARAPAGATLFVWGYDPVLYLTEGLSPSDRYVYLFPLVTPGYGSADRTAALLAEWRGAPPDVIVEGDSSVPLNRARPVGGDSRDLDTLQPLRDFVHAHYRLAASFAAEDVYVLATPG